MSNYPFGKIAVTAIAMIMAGSVANAQPVPYQSGKAQLNVETRSSPVRTQVLNLPKGRSAVIDLPVDAADVFVSNPAVADAVLRNPRRIFVLGVATGQSDAIFFDASGRQILNLSVRVEAPTDQLADTIRRIYPQAQVEVENVNGFVILNGLVANAAEAEAIQRLASAFAEKPENVINSLAIAGQDQVMLKVRIVEVERNTIKQLGLAADVVYNNGTRSYSFGRGNTFSTNGGYQGGRGLCYSQRGARTTNYNNSTSNSGNLTLSNGIDTSTTNTSTLNEILSYNTDGSIREGLTQSNSVTDSQSLTEALGRTVGSTVSSAWSSITGNDAQHCLEAFERVGLVRTLAEPNLTAVSGEAARFLAGGEFPVPVNQDTQGRISVEFKPFGVGLGFTPVVLSGGRISMKLSTEVSELTNTGAYTLNGNFTIPALSVRRAETTVEMQSGASLMIAGLLQSNYKQTIDSLPGLTSLPVLGSLFRSRDFLSEETELVVIVTPYLVKPGHPDSYQTPADNLQASSDMEAIFLGRLNKVVREGKGDYGTESPPPGAYQAPIGYVIE
ncbi:MAG: type II and III secretion system protein family protein [Asticcacaulis sp.]